MVLAVYSFIALALLMQAAIDIRIRRLPRQISYLVLLISTPFFIFIAISSREPHRILTALLGAVLSVLVFSGARRLSPRSLGAGDVHLSPLLGASLGWWGLRVLLMGAGAAFLLAALVVAGGLCTHRFERNDSIALGPYLVGGWLVAVVACITQKSFYG